MKDFPEPGTPEYAQFVKRFEEYYRRSSEDFRDLLKRLGLDKK